jgi:hypothetical protein
MRVNFRAILRHLKMALEATVIFDLSMLEPISWCFEQSTACKVGQDVDWNELSFDKVSDGADAEQTSADCRQDISFAALGSNFTTKILCGIALVGIGVSPVDAACWQDTNLSGIAAQEARRAFPDLLSRMPTVVVCEDSDFDWNVGGDYNSGRHRIRIPEKSTGANLVGVLRHELAHAATSIRGLDDGSFGGHGVGWLRVMLQAGFDDEARRVANGYLGGADALASAYEQVHGRPPRSPGSLPGGYVSPPADQPPPPLYAPPIYVRQPICTVVRVLVRRVIRGHYITDFYQDITYCN